MAEAVSPSARSLAAEEGAEKAAGSVEAVLFPDRHRTVFSGGPIGEMC